MLILSSISIISLIISFIHSLQIILCKRHSNTYHHHKIAFFYAFISILIFFLLFYFFVLHKEEMDKFILNPIGYLKKIDIVKGASVFWSFVLSTPLLVNIIKNFKDLKNELTSIIKV